MVSEAIMSRAINKTCVFMINDSLRSIKMHKMFSLVFVLWRFFRGQIYCLSIPFCIRHHQFPFLGSFFFGAPLGEEEEVRVAWVWKSRSRLSWKLPHLLVVPPLSQAESSNCFWRFASLITCRGPHRDNREPRKESEHKT